MRRELGAFVAALLAVAGGAVFGLALRQAVSGARADVQLRGELDELRLEVEVVDSQHRRALQLLRRREDELAERLTRQERRRAWDEDLRLAVLDRARVAIRKEQTLTVGGSKTQ